MTSPPPAPASPADAAGISRRRLLIGAAGSLVVAAGGVSVLSTTSSGGSSTPAASTPATSTPAANSPPSTIVATPTTTAQPVGGRVLVVLQLSGGNDALNTLVPLAGSYHDARPSIGLADESLLALPGDSGFGLHPSFAPLAALISAGQVGVVAGVGFPEPDRSHFSALDMWWSASPDGSAHTGWLGRWLDATRSPTDAVMRAVGLGGAVPALRADVSTSIGVNEIDQFAFTGGSPTLVQSWATLSADHLAALTATEAFAALEVPGADGAFGDGVGPATQRLTAAAQLIATQPDARVIHVSITGFDTHSNQLATHQGLLDDVATGIAAFQAALQASGHADRVLLLTTSEFGRRVVENGSAGTDHGKAGVQFLIGTAVAAPSVFGSLDANDLVDGDLRPVVDPRSMYATALDWLSADANVTDAVLGAAFERLPFGT